MGSEFILVSKISDFKDEITIYHAACKNTFDVKPRTFMSQNERCPFCRINKRTLNTEKFKQKVYQLVGNEYNVLGEYVKSNIKIKMKHNICNHIYNVKPANFSIGKRCPKCGNNIHKDTEYYRNEIHELTSGEYSVLGEYVGNTTKTEYIHNICGNSFVKTPADFLRRTKKACRVCFGHKDWSREIFITELKKLSEDIILISEFTGMRKMVTLQHIQCGYKFETNAYKALFEETFKCPKCFGFIRRTHDYFVSEVEEKF